MAKKLVVWDFHGVLEMGTEVAVHEITNHALQKFGYSARYTKEGCDAHYGKKWHLYFRELMPDLSIEKCFELGNFCCAYSEQNPHLTERLIKPHPKAHSILKTLSERGHKQILISNCQKDFLMRCLRWVNVTHSFDQIYAQGNTNAKVDVLQTYLQQCGEPYEEIIAIDDQPDNLSFKKIANLKFCLYRHHPPFPECSADHFTHDLEEVPNFLEKRLQI